ncbi:hypothetical protein [Effusibacillus pohliae]|uniref:hypothetical protein n=1 Tax=Effusibacillus pohliae TaxID=232270 RepID=UPI00036B9DA2|nr:hypothetical protein [Effusibacillus pohliae]
MKKLLLASLSAVFLAGGMFAFVYLIGNADPAAPKFNPEAHADWPSYPFEQLLSRTDVVALVTVSKTDKNPRPMDDRIPSQLATLQVKQVLYGTAPSEVVLDQAVEYAKPGETYVMFLTKHGDYYYEVDGNSKLLNTNGIIRSNIPDLKGDFTVDQFAAQLKQAIPKK